MDPKTLHVVMTLIKDTVISAQVGFMYMLNISIYLAFERIPQKLCSAAHACSKKDPFTGLTKNEFKTPYTLPQTIGGWVPVSFSTEKQY